MRIPLAVAAALALAVLALESFGSYGRKVAIGVDNAAAEVECGAAQARGWQGSLQAGEVEVRLAFEDCVN